MQLQVGDWVRTETGEVGQIVLISRVTYFVDFGDKTADTIKAYLEEQLTKVDPPENTGSETKQ